MAQTYLPKSLKRTALVLSTLLGLACSSASADSVYKWVDPDGITHYSSTPPHPQAEPADLPPITRGDVRLTEQRLETCDNHGDINCQAGADSDGSVICYDGYRNAAAIYRFNCNSPKLEISDISEPKKDGEFSVFVRNSKSVPADKPELIVRTDEITTGIQLEGPTSIEPFGMAEFIYKPNGEGAKLTRRPTLAQLTLTCGNCLN